MKIILCFFFIFTTFILRTDSRGIKKNCLQKKHLFDWSPVNFPNFYVIPYNNKRELFIPNYSHEDESDLIEESNTYCPCTGSAVCTCPAGCTCQEKNVKSESETRCPCTGGKVCVCGENSPCKGKCGAAADVAPLSKRSELREPDNTETFPEEEIDQPVGCPCTGNLNCECPENSGCGGTCGSEIN